MQLVIELKVQAIQWNLKVKFHSVLLLPIMYEKVLLRCMQSYFPSIILLLESLRRRLDNKVILC